MSHFASNPIIANECMLFHTQEFPVEIFSNPEERFGTLSITVSKTKKTTKPLYIQCTIDNSDSMSEQSANHSRLDYVKRTIVKMFEFLVETIETDVHVHVDTFSTNFTTLIDTILLTKENAKEITEKVMSLDTQHMTNIELALNNSDKKMMSILDSNPEYNAIHLFLTDGDATIGSRNVDTLVKLVNPHYTTVFIGYGAQHNSNLLSKCANKTVHNKYVFVDNFEYTGIVYGEVLHGLLYSAVKDVTITMSPDSFIYDAMSNQWVQTLMIPSLLSEKEHVYHVKSTSQQDSQAIVAGTIQNQLDSHGRTINITGENEILSSIDQLPNLTDENNIVEAVDLSKYIFRQKTMEMLYAASKLHTHKKSILELKEELKVFYKQMQLYMEAKGLKKDTFMKILCEDVYICYSTLGTNEGCMLSESRNTSQRHQTVYRCGSETHRGKRNRIVRQNANCSIQRSCSIQNHYDLEEPETYQENPDEYEEKDETTNDPNDATDIDNYNTEFINEQVYSTQQTIEVTRAVSD